jgi:hypothetical protein
MLAVSIGGGDAAAGTVYRSLRFTNISGQGCTLQGFPGVSYVAGDGGTQVGPAADRDGAKGAAVTLKPGAVASVTLAMTNVHNFDAPTCHPTPTRGLRIYPPNETASLYVATAGLGCTAPTLPSPQLRVSTMKAGPGER